jgi:hypothetical protein
MPMRWLVLIGLLAAPAAGQGPAERAAVAKAAGYLKAKYAGGGPLAGGGHANHALGEAALAGLALLEAGVPAADPVVQSLAARVRPAALGDTSTYAVALAVLFLDRLGDPADRPVVQMLGVKLYAGLSLAGGWGYSCSQAGPVDGTRLLAMLSESTLTNKPKEKPEPPKQGFVRPTQPKPAEPPSSGVHPAVEPYWKRVQSQAKSGGRGTESGDNSNTQFGLIGLWVAARNGLPADDAFELIERRFLGTQAADAGWGYTPSDGKSTPSMTCAGLLGLAVGAGRHTRTPPDRRGPLPGPKDGFVRPTKPLEPDELPQNARNKRAAAAALAAIGQVVRFTLGGGAGKLGGFVGLGNEYYLLWSVERVCMAYGLDTLGDADWYAWGRDFLLPAQQADGSWPQVGLCSQDVDTCFAVLFLMKSNVTRDMKLGAKDPGVRDLKAGDPDKLPPLSAPREAAKEANPLVLASDADFPAKLTAVRDAKGAENTQTLATAIPRLSPARQKAARTALAERLARMTATTLRGMLKDGSEEVKRAAAAAVVAKADRTMLSDLITLLGDKSTAASAAAHAALKALTGQDHGPPDGADAAAKQKAQEAWRKAIR